MADYRVEKNWSKCLFSSCLKKEPGTFTVDFESYWTWMHAVISGVCVSFDTIRITCKSYNEDAWGLFPLWLLEGGCSAEHQGWSASWALGASVRVDSRLSLNQGPASPLICRGSPLTPVRSQAPMISDHQHANTAQYFNFLPKKRDFRGRVRFRSAVWCLLIQTSLDLMPKTRDTIVLVRILQTPGPLCVKKTLPCCHPPAWQ